jgi:LuxR family maltose regulon positive regulatory protein
MATMTESHDGAVGYDESAVPLLAARCAVPRLPRRYVDRPRLLARLDRGASLPLTLVSAPAGSGKTALVAAWVRSRPDSSAPPRSIGWITFEAGDDRPRIFWPLVMACLRGHGVALPVDLLDGDGRAHRTALSAVGAALAAEERPVTLVLDGYEIADAELADGLGFLLSHSGGRLRLVILSRADPILPLHRFRLSEEMAELRMADLAFTEAEASELLAGAGVALQAETMRGLVDRTRGWAAGLRFTSMLLADSDEPDIAAARVTGDTGNIGEYLMAEILQSQPADVRDVLLRTSVVEWLQPGLTEHLGGRTAGRTLAALAHANVLVEEIAAGPGWYRYHPFLRELLCAELAYSSSSLLASQQERAVTWYAEHGLVAVVPNGSAPTAAITVETSATVPVRAVVPPPRAPTDSQLIEPLTAKEREVLGHLAELLTTDEIAAAMFVSVNTVRTHVRNILRKLAVGRRNDAVRRARALNLLGT